MSEATALSTTNTLPTVSLLDGKPVTDSRNIAAAFNKTHRSVLLTIDTILAAEPELALHEIMQGSYTVPETGSHQHRRFLLTRDGFALVAMGFTGGPALKWKRSYIAAFNAMEAELCRRQQPAPFDPNDPASLRAVLLGYTERLMIAEATATEALQGKAAAEAVIEEQRPKVEAFEQFLDAEGVCTLATVARAINAPQKLFFAWVREQGYCFDRDGFLQPRADLRKGGYMKLSFLNVTNEKRVWRTVVTSQGIEWLRQRWYVGPGKTLRLQAAVADRQGKLAV